MSEPVSATVADPHAATPAALSAASPEGSLFTEREIEQFDADDGDAGRAIGKMLATFFLYTVVVMLGVAWWTLTRH